jgi:thiosulfate reductase cytochrome b subunit
MTGTRTHRTALSSVTRGHVAGAAMLVGIATAAGLVVVLWLAGLGSLGVGVAAGFLVITCLAVCLMAALTGHRCARDIDAAAAQLVAARRGQYEEGRS